MRGRITLVLMAATVAVLGAAAALILREMLASTMPEPTSTPVGAAEQHREQEESERVSESIVQLGSPAARQDTRPPATGTRPGRQATPETRPAPPLSRRPADNGIGTVSFVKGNVTAARDNDKARLLAVGSTILLNDVVQTAPESRVEIRFNDGTTVSQGENSIIRIDVYVYDPGKSDSCSFALRIARGVCRVVTGLITKTNPDRFKVRTKMATVGIRGCELAFKSFDAGDDIYVLTVTPGRAVTVDTTTGGTEITDPATGKTIDVPELERKAIEIAKPGMIVSLRRGAGPALRAFTSAEYAAIMSESSHPDPARYNLRRKPDGAIFDINTGGETKDAPQ